MERCPLCWQAGPRKIGPLNIHIAQDHHVEQDLADELSIIAPGIIGLLQLRWALIKTKHHTAREN